MQKKKKHLKLATGKILIVFRWEYVHVLSCYLFFVKDRFLIMSNSSSDNWRCSCTSVSWLVINVILVIFLSNWFWSDLITVTVRNTNTEYTYLKDQFFEKYQNRIVVEISKMTLQMSPSKRHKDFALVLVLWRTIIWQSDSKMMYLSIQRDLIISINLLIRHTYKSKGKKYRSYHQKYWRPHFLWTLSNRLKSSQRYLRDERLHLLTFTTISTRESHRSVILICALSRRFDPDTTWRCSSSEVSS